MSHQDQAQVRTQFDIEPHVGRRLEDVERELILKTLARCGGNRTWASDILGISIRTLRNKLLRYEDEGNTPAKTGRATKSEREAHIARLKEFEPGRQLPS